MAAREDGGHPFNWFIIGFVVGVAATLAALLWLGAKHDRHAPREDTEAVAVEPAPEATPRVAHPAAIPALPLPPKKVTAPAEAHHAAPRESDEQMAEDAAAAGMTSRTTPGQPQPQDPQ